MAAVIRTYTHEAETIPETEVSAAVTRPEPFNLVAYLTRTNVAIPRRKDIPAKKRKGPSR